MEQTHKWDRKQPSRMWWCKVCKVCGGNNDEPADIGPCKGVPQGGDFCAPGPPRPTPPATPEPALMSAAQAAADFIRSEYACDNDVGEVIPDPKARKVFEDLLDAIHTPPTPEREWWCPKCKALVSVAHINQQGSIKFCAECSTPVEDKAPPPEPFRDALVLVKERTEERFLSKDDGDWVTHEEAEQIALKFINQHFKNPGKERPRASIPADRNRDDDLRLMQYIRQCKRQLSTPEPVSLLRAKVVQAVARGWCHDQNSAKVMDHELAEAIVDEVCIALASVPVKAEAGEAFSALQARCDDLERWKINRQAYDKGIAAQLDAYSHEVTRLTNALASKALAAGGGG